MGRKLLCALLVCLASTSVEANPEEVAIPLELTADKTSFAYRVRHSVHPLPKAALDTSVSSDRALQWTVAERTVVIAAEATRPNPSRDVLCRYAAAVAETYKLPAPFFANLIQQESGFKAHVVSPVGAQGIAQFMPRVARAYGLENPFDPVHSMTASAKFLRELLAQFGNLGLAAAAYNAGPQRVQNWLAMRGKLPEETRNYVRNITGQSAERWARVNAPTEGQVLPSHARCPGLPMIEVNVPEAAPVKLAIRNNKTGLVGAANKPSAEAAGNEKSRTGAATGGQKIAMIKGGSLKIMMTEGGRAKDLAKVAARLPKDNNDAARTANRSKLTKSQTEPAGAKRVRVAASR